MNYRLGLATALLALAACGGGEKKAEEGGTATGGGSTASTTTPTEVAKAAATKMTPGQWEISNEILEMSMPGVPAGAMPAQMKNKTSVKTCLTHQQAEKPDADFFAGRRNKDCTYKDFSMAGGHVKGTVTCQTEGGPTTMTMDGQYEPEKYEMTMAMQSERMNMKMHTEGKRVGECPASGG